MTNRDRDSAARLLIQVAERLRSAAARAETSPHDCSISCAAEAHAIDVVVAEYLKPNNPRPRGKR